MVVVRRYWPLLALLVLLLLGGGAGAALYLTVSGSDERGGEVVLARIDDPGPDPFTPPTASLPPTNAKFPTVPPQGDGTDLVSQPYPGDRERLYGGTLDNASCDREQMIAFLMSHPAEAAAFVAALNADPTLYWSGGRPLTESDLPAYLRELTPVLLRADTRVTNHGFDGQRPTPFQAVMQAGTAVLVDDYGIPRARCYCGNPLTPPVPLTRAPVYIGQPWEGYHPGAVVVVEPNVVINTFVLVDVVTGQTFTRPAHSTGDRDAAVPSETPAPAQAPVGPTPAPAPVPFGPPREAPAPRRDAPAPPRDAPAPPRDAPAPPRDAPAPPRDAPAPPRDAPAPPRDAPAPPPQAPAPQAPAPAPRAPAPQAPAPQRQQPAPQAPAPPPQAPAPPPQAPAPQHQQPAPQAPPPQRQQPAPQAPAPQHQQTAPQAPAPQRQQPAPQAPAPTQHQQPAPQAPAPQRQQTAPQAPAPTQRQQPAPQAPAPTSQAPAPQRQAPATRQTTAPTYLIQPPPTRGTLIDGTDIASDDPSVVVAAGVPTEQLRGATVQIPWTMA
ncbi:DUF6777 domain-containing protein [Nocardia amamiensis]|uniref:DUF6777 domain-containing protein n=1 Tax=Nocardia amamiensis TaxID=404578 RepID=UPI000B0D72D9